MQCKSCGTELPKKAKICPKCGALNGKPTGNTRYLAIIGMVIMLLGGLLPFVQSIEGILIWFHEYQRYIYVVSFYVDYRCWYSFSCC